jgi:hypothetical protein
MTMDVGTTIHGCAIAQLDNNGFATAITLAVIQ